MKTNKMKLNPDQIRGRIATHESELGALTTAHDNQVKEFNAMVARNQQKHAELTGGIAALKALLDG